MDVSQLTQVAPLPGYIAMDVFDGAFWRRSGSLVVKCQLDNLRVLNFFGDLDAAIGKNLGTDIAVFRRFDAAV